MWGLLEIYDDAESRAFWKKIFFIYIVSPAVVGRCWSQLASNVDPPQLAKSLLAFPIPLYIYYIKEARYFVYHDES